MRVLLLAMPDTAQFVDFLARLPNLAIISLAGNLPGHEVRVLDLILFKPHFEAALRRALSGLRPQVVGLSAMTFQFDTRCAWPVLSVPLTQPLNWWPVATMSA